ncbi:NUDIX hydrolase [soil metagenome]
MEQRVVSTIVFDGRIVSVRVDQVERAGGRHSTREVVEHPGAVAIVPITTSGNVLLVEQYRYAVNRTLLEVPAGSREAGESPLETARRELEEETGYRAASLVEIGRFFVSPGWATEEIILFRAGALDSIGHGFDHDEILDVLEIEPARIPVLMRDGKIADAKTIIGLQLVLTNLQ